MERESPTAVATAFLERFSDGEFDGADALVHPDGPLDGAADVAMVFSLLLTDFLATLVLGAVPTAVTDTTVVEEGPSTARVEASLDIAGAATVDALVALRPVGYEENDPGDGRRDGWSVWNVDTDF